MKKQIIGALGKARFDLGLNPKVEKSKKDYKQFIPPPFESVCLISADFELAWAFRFSKFRDDPITHAVKQGIATRENVPHILDLSDRYEIPITWATVGHLFLDKCEKTNGTAHPELERLPRFENKYWRFDQNDWFDADPCTDYINDPAWYCPDLIQEIMSRQVQHEIGCHTFSHIDCSDAICPKSVFNAEISKCIGLAREKGIRLKSFVHPGHQIGHLKELDDFGFTSFRSGAGYHLAFPRRHSKVLWEFKNSGLLDWRSDWTTEYHIYRFTSIIDRAIKHHRPCVLYFHPSMNARFVSEVFPALFKYLDQKRDQILITTHSKYSDWLNSGKRDF